MCMSMKLFPETQTFCSVYQTLFIIILLFQFENYPYCYTVHWVEHSTYTIYLVENVCHSSDVFFFGQSISQSVSRQPQCNDRQMI